MPLHPGPRVIGIAHPILQRPHPAHQFVEIGLLHVGHMVVLDQRQRVVSARQPHAGGVGAVIGEPAGRLPGMLESRPSTATKWPRWIT